MPSQRRSLSIAGGAILLASGLASGCGGYGGGGNGGGGGGSAPMAVMGLIATAGNAQVSLTWNASGGATGYYVKRSTTSGAETQIAAQAGTSYADNAVTNGTKYFYTVSAYNSYGTSADSTEVSATPTAPALTAPTNLVATSGDSQVALTWAAVSAATSYNVKRSTTSGTETTVSSPTTNAFTDTGLTNGTKYFYVVSAASGATESANSSEVNATPVAAAVNVTITVNPAVTKPISPFIYGTNFYGGNANAPSLLTMDRAGGNRWTAYNWITNGSNAGNDYFYETDDYLCQMSQGCDRTKPAEAVRLLISDDQLAGLASLITLQVQGYVSKDTTLVQVTPPFPNLTDFRPVVDKKSTASAAPFTLTPPAVTTDSNVYMDEFAWALDQKFPGKNIFGASPTNPTFISLDNEPELWNSTHEEIQGSTRITSDAYITKTLTLTKALKDQFPNMVIFGPVHYGFLGLYNWQGELTATPNGTNWFSDKYLNAIKSASTTYGKPLVDVYDFHWYPEEYDATSTRILNLTGTTLTSAQVQLIVQSPRNLWDPTFNDAANGNSNPWVYQTLGSTPVNLLGRLQAKINAENPGMNIAITEYEGGGWNHIAGTIAQADYLGIFGAQGLFAASFWPPNGTYDYAMAGFRAYRGFDGATASFGNTSLQATSSNVANVMVYASADSTTPGRYVFVAINRSPTSQVTAINGVTLSGIATIYQITASSASGQNPIHPVQIGSQAASGTSLKVTLPALSVTTIEVK